VTGHGSLKIAMEPEKDDGIQRGNEWLAHPEVQASDHTLLIAGKPATNDQLQKTERRLTRTSLTKEMLEMVPSGNVTQQRQYCLG
jgi:hypothetical protein